jgi:hypothetical protein
MGDRARGLQSGRQRLGVVSGRPRGARQNAARSKFEIENELVDTGVFDENRYFDADIEYAKSAAVIPSEISTEATSVARQAFAGVLWSKRFYHYVVEEWLDGDPGQPSPPTERHNGRNHKWQHLYARDVIAMPDLGISLVRVLGSRLPLHRARLR